MKEQIINKQKTYKISCICLVVISIILSIFMLIKATTFDGLKSEGIISYVAYLVLVAIPLVFMGCYFTKLLNSEGGGYKQKIVCIWSIIAFIFLIVLLTANFRSGDYNKFLSIWTDYYRQHSLRDALYGIVDVSNYAPAYNYLLIIISRIPMSDLYLIKYVTFLFSLYLAFIVCKLVAKLRGEKQINPLIFLVVMILPHILFEYSYWGQCDAIYVSFAITSLYFAICKKSKLSFLFVGLSFAFKLQFLFIVPILYVLLIVKDKDGAHYLKWKDIWIAILPYLINLIPAITGRPIQDLLLVYFNQMNYDARLSGKCFNFCAFYQYWLHIDFYSLASKIIIIVHTVITILLLCVYLFIIFRHNKKYGLNYKDILFWSVCFAFTMVFLMPKMLDRFYAIAYTLAVVLLFSFREDKHFVLSSTFLVGLISCVMVSTFIPSNVDTIIGAGLNCVLFGYFIYIIVKFYIKPKSKKER